MMTTSEQIKNIKLARVVDLGLTQERMAQQLGVSLRTYSRWEKSGAHLRALQHIALLVSQHAKEPSQGSSHA